MHELVFTHEHFMSLALRQAQIAAENQEVPVGAVIVHGNAIVGQAHNQTEMLKDPTAHAEIIAITQAASALEDWRLLDTVLYVTKEPCPMCAGAIVQARIPTVVYGVDDIGRGGAKSLFPILDSPDLNHRCEIITGILEAPCRALLQKFFREKRK
jgi:tRNA(adenine34) deaminase